MLTFRQKLELQKIVIEQNKILARAPGPEEKMEAERIKKEAMANLGIIGRLDSKNQH